MALTYTESANLMKDNAFVDRVKVACLKYADFIMGEASTVPAHSARLRWAQMVNTNPDTAAQMITPETVMDPAVQGAGSAIDDPGLQSAVENAVNKFL